MMIETYIMHKLEDVAEHVYAEKPEQPDSGYPVPGADGLCGSHRRAGPRGVRLFQKELTNS